MGKLSENDINEILFLYKKGWNKSQIARKFNVSTTTIYRKLIEYNICDNKLSKQEKEGIYKHYLMTKSMVATSKKYNIEPCIVLSVINEYGLKPYTQEENHRKYTFNENYFENIDTPNKAYILGLIYSDGCICETDKGVYLGLEEEDKYLLEQVNTELENTKPLMLLSKQNNNSKNQYRIVIYSAKMQNDLMNVGVRYRKSWDLDYPFYLHKDLHSHFCRGYFDGDGSIFQTKRSNGNMRTVTDIAGTENICKGIQEILSQNDIFSLIYDTSAHNGITRTVRIARKEEIEKLYYWLYKDKGLYMYRKYNRFIQYLNINNSLSM